MNEITLYKISEEQRRINYQLEESGGEITPELEEALSINHENFLVKSEGYIATIHKYGDLSDAISAEIKRLQSFKKTADNISGNLKKRLLQAMEVFGMEKAEVGLYRLSMRRTTSVVIDNEAQLPNKYIVVTTTPDKTLIKEDLKSGKDAPGASLHTNVSLQIR